MHAIARTRSLSEAFERESRERERERERRAAPRTTFRSTDLAATRHGGLANVGSAQVRAYDDRA